MKLLPVQDWLLGARSTATRTDDRDQVTPEPDETHNGGKRDTEFSKVLGKRRVVLLQFASSLRKRDEKGNDAIRPLVSDFPSPHAFTLCANDGPHCNNPTQGSPSSPDYSGSPFPLSQLSSGSADPIKVIGSSRADCT